MVGYLAIFDISKKQFSSVGLVDGVQTHCKSALTVCEWKWLFGFLQDIVDRVIVLTLLFYSAQGQLMKNQKWHKCTIM